MNRQTNKETNRHCDIYIVDKHINSIVKKANMMLGLIKRHFSYMNTDMFIKLYKSLVSLEPHS